MTDQHPITPPDKQLVRKWIEDWAGGQMKGPVTEDQLVVATQAAQWGADQELRACCDTLQRHAHWDLAVFELMDDRRPKPPSLAKRALHILGTHGDLSCAEHDTIRCALEALPE